jgi:hypothetical protein
MSTARASLPNPKLLRIVGANDKDAATTEAGGQR